MKNFLYFILIVMFLTYDKCITDNPKLYDLNDYTGGVIIDKTDDFIFGKMISIK